MSQPKGIAAPNETSEGQSAAHQGNEQAFPEAQISQSERMSTAKNHDSSATTDSDEVEVISFRSLTKGPVQGSPPIKTGPGLASVPQTANTDEAQARIDKIIHGSTPFKKLYCNTRHTWQKKNTVRTIFGPASATICKQVANTSTSTQRTRKP